MIGSFAPSPAVLLRSAPLLLAGVVLALALLAGRALADPPAPTLLTTGPIAVGTHLAWADPAPEPGYALVGGNGGDIGEIYTCPPDGGVPSHDVDPDTLADCNHRGGGEYDVKARDVGLDIYYVDSAAPTPFVPGGCCVYYVSAPVLVPAGTAPPVTTVPITTPVPVVVPATPATPTPVLPAPTAPATTPKVPATPVAPKGVKVGPAVATPSRLTLASTASPGLTVTCQAACRAVVGAKLRAGTATTALKSQAVKLAAGGAKSLTIRLTPAQRRAVAKALAAHRAASVVVVLHVTGQARTAQLTYTYHR